MIVAQIFRPTLLQVATRSAAYMVQSFEIKTKDGGKFRTRVLSFAENEKRFYLIGLKYILRVEWNMNYYIICGEERC